MPNPTTNFKNSFGTDLGNIIITKEYLMTVYPQIAANMITPELWVWGRNNQGQLGDNTAIDRSTPVTTFAGGANWKSVSSGVSGTAAIKTDGTLWTWGQNYNGSLGVNDTTQRCTPVTTFAGGTNWKQVSFGSLHTAAIKTDGTLWTWGYNYYGRLGNNIGGNTNTLTPVTTFAGGTNWKQVSCGNQNTAAIKTDGTLWTWGENFQGAVGINISGGNNRRSTPVTTFAGGTNWKQVSVGYHVAAIKTDGTLWTWGSNGSGQLGDNTKTIKYFPVTTFAGGTNWKQVSCSIQNNRFVTSAIKTDGTLWTWGENSYGQLGDNTITDRCTPVTTFVGGTNWKQVSVGGNRIIAAIKTDGTLWIWGRNSNGQLAINASGFTTEKCTPVTTFAGGTNWKQVSCGDAHTAAIKTSDDLLGI
jgi:alpha-tubulin suppressor-like RCC1 family protein